MQTLTHERYQQMRAGAQTLEADSFGDKVLQLADGNFIKLFRRKRLLSSALIWPYAQRFANNAQSLQDLGIPCPKVIGVYRLVALQRDLVHYHPLPGLTLRQLRNAPDAPSDLLERLAIFIAELHEKGVYFRSLHLGNVVLTPKGELGLIDIADLKIQRCALSQAQRVRNFRHTLRDTKDRDWLRSAGDARFATAYRNASGTTLQLDTLE
ncbi:MAG: toluene tolerance protein [Pseudomonas sp.]|nr:toluene tolerance protein [Pseudomonas sp.]